MHMMKKHILTESLQPWLFYRCRGEGYSVLDRSCKHQPLGLQTLTLPPGVNQTLEYAITPLLLLRNWKIRTNPSHAVFFKFGHMYLSRPTECISHRLTSIFLFLSSSNPANASPRVWQILTSSQYVFVQIMGWHKSRRFFQICGTRSCRLLRPLSPPPGRLVIPTHRWHFELFGIFLLFLKVQIAFNSPFLGGLILPSYQWLARQPSKMVKLIDPQKSWNVFNNQWHEILCSTINGMKLAFNMLSFFSRCSVHIPGE